MKKNITIIAACLGLFPLSVFSATVTYTGTVVPASETNTTDTPYESDSGWFTSFYQEITRDYDLPQFNTALGTLIQVQLTLDSTNDWGFTVNGSAEEGEHDFDTTTADNFVLNYDESYSHGLTALAPGFSLNALDFSVTDTPVVISPVNYTESGTAPERFWDVDVSSPVFSGIMSTNASIATGLTPWEGAGVVTLSATNILDVDYLSENELPEADWNDNWDAGATQSFSVTYTYESVAVPEPSMAFLSGLGGLALFLKRKRKA